MVNTPISFKIEKTRSIFEKQWTYLLERLRKNKWQEALAFFIILIAASGLYVLFIFFSASNAFITAKVLGLVMLVLAWCFLVIKLVAFILDKRKSRVRLQNFLNETTDEQLRYTVLIDDNYVTIFSHENSLQMPWTEFTHYGIHNETLYVFNDARPIHTLYWDRSEMGDYEFDALLSLLQHKSRKRRF
jgi:hypothetical protein